MKIESIFSNIREPRMYIRACILFCMTSFAGCSTTPKPPSENGGMFRERNEGYSLLYKLMGDESKVGGIFVLKHADDSVKGLVKEIGTACTDAKKQMDGFPLANNRIEYDVPDLPRLEQESRDLEAKQEEKDLLFSSGKTFELKLIFTQAEAMGYAVNLCQSLAAHEDDAGHKEFLTTLSKQCADFQQRLMDLLTVKS